MAGRGSFLKDDEDSSLFTCTFNLIRSNLAVLSVTSTLLLIFIGWGVYHVSPLNSFEELEYKQEQNDLKRDFVQFHNELGDYFLNIGQVDAAKYEFKQVLEVDSLNQTARYSLFKCEIFEPISNKTGYDPEISRKRLEIILEKSNYTDPHAYLFLGNLYLPIDKEKAFKNYQKAVDLDSSVAAAYEGMGIIYDHQNKPDEALEMYEKALSISPWNQNYLNDVADEYYEKKEYQKAIDSYDLLLKLNNKYLVSYYPISNSYRLTGDLESALGCQKALTILLEDDSVTDLENNQQIWYFHMEPGQEVYFLDYPEKKIYAYYNLALTYYLLGNENKTVEFLTKANELHIDEDLELNIKKLVIFDIDNLQKEQPIFLNRTEEFRKKFLSRSTISTE